MATCKDCIHYDICIFHLKGNENEKCVQFINTADVVPGSEYDHLKFEFDELDRECDRLEEVEARQDDTIVQAKRDAAREIFEDIKATMFLHLHEHRPFGPGEYVQYFSIELEGAINELKKKYTEDKK